MRSESKLKTAVFIINFRLNKKKIQTAFIFQVLLTNIVVGILLLEISPNLHYTLFYKKYVYRKHESEIRQKLRILKKYRQAKLQIITLKNCFYL